MAGIRYWLSKAMMIFGFIMVTLYIVLGIGLLTFPYFEKIIDPNIKVGIALFFLAYGCYRLFRQISKLKNKETEEETAYYEKD